MRNSTAEADLRPKAFPGEVESGSQRRTVVRQGEPLFADKDMRQLWNLRRFQLIPDHQVIPDHRVITYEP